MKTVSRKRSYTYRYMTSGEALYARLRQWLFSEVASDHMYPWLRKIEYYAEELQEFLEQTTALWLTARLVSVGRSLYSENGHHYRTELRPFLREYLVLSRNDLEDIERLLGSAVDASLQNISNGLKNKMLQYAIDQHELCYICGIPLDFSMQDKHSKFTREHIWPRSLGGESIIENLLPACGKCNHLRKMDYATWASTSIQSICTPRSPSDDDWKNLQLSHYYAMHQFAGQSRAISEYVTLKEAFLDIGPWKCPPKLCDKNDAGHFFNLEVI